jgi:5-methylcytosine-specific restriction endonuclease McrA
MQSYLKKHVLVLDSYYNIIAVCTVRTALVLSFLDKVDTIVVVDGAYVNSPKTAHPVPSVIRFRQALHFNISIKESATHRNIRKRDNGLCVYCGNPGGTIDHVVPLVQGGRNTWRNLVVACISCNAKKGGRTPGEAGMTLRYKPFKPETTSIKFDWKTLPEEWSEYLSKKWGKVLFETPKGSSA